MDWLTWHYSTYIEIKFQVEWLNSLLTIFIYIKNELWRMANKLICMKKVMRCQLAPVGANCEILIESKKCNWRQLAPITKSWLNNKSVIGANWRQLRYYHPTKKVNVATIITILQDYLRKDLTKRRSATICEPQPQEYHSSRTKTTRKEPTALLAKQHLWYKYLPMRLVIAAPRGTNTSTTAISAARTRTTSKSSNERVIEAKP